jgi:hypothetical protein
VLLQHQVLDFPLLVKDGGQLLETELQVKCIISGCCYCAVENLAKTTTDTSTAALLVSYI